jgi:hypothetical protein
VLGATALALPARSSRAADPTTAECLAANNSSIDLRNGHRLRDARAQLLVCAATSCPTDVRKECLRRVDEVTAQIPTVIFEAKDASGKDLSAVAVTMDGHPLADRLVGTPISIDPGEHTFTFETAGQPRVTRQFVIQESQKDRREAVAFGAAALPASGPANSVAPASPRTPEAGSGWGTQKLLALVAGGIGMVGLGAGGAFGLQAVSKRNDAQNVCPKDCTSTDGVRMWNDALSAAQVSDVLFIVGGVGLVSGAILWLTAGPPSSAPSAQLGFGPASVHVKGAW